MPQQPRILVVEDDEPTREVVLIKLDKAGITCEFAKDGKEGMEKLESGIAFDGVLLDIRMPNWDGFTFMEAKNTNPHLKDVPVIVFSNFSQPEFVARAVALGAKGYLVKAQHTLQDVVDEVQKCVVGGVCTIDG